MGAETAIFAIIYVIVGTFALGGISAAPWVPTKRRQRARLAEVVPLKDGATVYDLGCGDGSVLFDLVKRNPTIRAVGYEISVLPYLIGLIRAAAGGAAYRNVTLRYRDFFGQRTDDADVVFTFLLKDCYPRVMAKLAKELKDDALVVVEAWPFPGIAAERTVEGDRDLLPIYFYRGSQLKA